MVIDRKVMFTIRMAKNIAAMPEEQRMDALSHVHPGSLNLVTVTVNAMLSRDAQAS